MESIITVIRPLVEILYFVAGIALTIGLALAFKQLALLKAESESRSRRSAAEKAIEAADLYFVEYIALTKVYFDTKITSKVPHYSGPIRDFSSASLPAELRDQCTNRFGLLNWLPALNRLESIAARFTTGVADEKVGFAIFGRTFCASVEDMYDLIAISRKEEAVGYWSNIVQLYKVWHPRLTEAELKVARNSLDSRLSAMATSSIAPLK